MKITLIGKTKAEMYLIGKRLYGRHNGEAQRRQITFASPPRSRFRPLQRSVRCAVTTDIFKHDSPALHRDQEISLR
jgi:hypothetical protein